MFMGLGATAAPSDVDLSNITAITGGVGRLSAMASGAKTLYDVYRVANLCRALAQEIFDLGPAVYAATSQFLPGIYTYQAKAASLSQGAIQPWSAWDGHTVLNPWSPGFTPFSSVDWEAKEAQLEAAGATTGASETAMRQASATAIQSVGLPVPTAQQPFAPPPPPAPVVAPSAPVQTRLPTVSTSPAATVPGAPGGGDPVQPVPSSSLADDAANAAQATGVALQHGLGVMSPKTLMFGALALGLLLLR